MTYGVSFLLSPPTYAASPLGEPAAGSSPGNAGHVTDRAILLDALWLICMCALWIMKDFSFWFFLTGFSCFGLLCFEGTDLFL